MLLNTCNHRYAFYILYLVYLCPCLVLDPFMLYMCDLFFIFNLVFILINNLIKKTHLFFVYFLEYFYYFWVKKANNFQKAKVQPQGVPHFADFLPISAWHRL